MSTFDLTKLIGYEFNGLDVDNVEIDNATEDPGSSTDYVPGSTTYTVLGSSAGVTLSGFGGNDSDTGFGTPATVSEQITNASNGTTLTGGALANPVALGQIEDIQTINGNPNSPVTYDVLGYSADGENILVGLSNSYNPAFPNDPNSGEYYILSSNNIDGNATPSNFFTSPVMFSASNTFLSNNVTVTNSLIGLKIPSNDLTLTGTGTAGVTVNANGTFTVVATTSTLSIGAVTAITAVSTAATGSQGQATLKFTASVPAYFQVVGFNSTQVLLQSVKSTGVAAAGPAYAILSLSNTPPTDTGGLSINFSPVGTAPLAGQAIPCFLRGTGIATPRGRRLVETLAPGDLVTTPAGETKPVVWVGCAEVNTRLHSDPARVKPVCIAAGAIADQVPQRDLYLSPDHAVFIDDMLIPVKELINGTTIRQVDRHLLEYFHVELAQHEIILAEGLSVETYLDTGNRATMEGGDLVFGAVDAPDMDYMIWEAVAYRPLTVSGAGLRNIRARLAHRSKATEWRKTA